MSAAAEVIMQECMCHWCDQFGPWGFARMSSGKPVERRRACKEHRDVGRHWHEEVNRG